MTPFLHFILPTRNQSFMLDLVVSAMAVVLIVSPEHSLRQAGKATPSSAHAVDALDSFVRCHCRF